MRLYKPRSRRAIFRHRRVARYCTLSRTGHASQSVPLAPSCCAAQLCDSDSSFLGRFARPHQPSPRASSAQRMTPALIQQAGPSTPAERRSLTTTTTTTTTGA